MSEPDAFDVTLKNLLNVFMRSSMSGFVRFAKERGLSMSQFNTLVHLRHKGSCGVSDIGDELGVSSAAASQMIDRLFQLGLIMRAEDPRDRRLKQIALSEKGEDLLREGMDARQQWIKHLTEILTAEEKQQLTSAFNLIISKISLAETPGEDTKGFPPPPRP